MQNNFLHNHKEFNELIRIVASNMKIEPVLVEKDYWIMHCLYSLQQLALKFELKGGTSLSKGFDIIGRFSEDIDIRIEPPESMNVSTKANQNKVAHVESRKLFYDWLTENIRIDSISKVERDHVFDDAKLRSAGIRLYYKETTSAASDLKDGVLLEVGFDDATPNIPKNISSWAYDHAVRMVTLTDNRAMNVPCYHPGYTFVEKLQAISTKFRKQQEAGDFPSNFLRHYYDVYCLLEEPSVLQFISTEHYYAHKAKRFRSENPNITANEAFLLSRSTTFDLYSRAYDSTRSLYYKKRPTFSEILARIQSFAEKL